MLAKLFVSWFAFAVVVGVAAAAAEYYYQYCYYNCYYLNRLRPLLSSLSMLMISSPISMFLLLSLSLLIVDVVDDLEQIHHQAIYLEVLDQDL